MDVSSTWRGHVEVWRNNGMRPPWVPTFEDVLLMQNACPDRNMLNRDARVLVLGVTPAIVMARWLEGLTIKAVDFDQDMIDALWQPEAGDRAEAVCADWSAMPFPDDYFDLVVGDGSFCALPDLGHYDAVIAEVMRVKRSEAPILARFFVQQEEALSFSDIVDPLGRLLLEGFEATEVRFLTLMAACDPDGILDHQTIAAKIAQRWGNLERFIAAACPDENDAGMFRLILERQQRLNFPRLSQISLIFARHGLRMKVFQPSYRVGAFCPTLRFD